MKDFILPDIGEGIVECELLKWLVAEGDTIVEDQGVAEVMTDKATVEIPAMYDGVVAKLYYKEGDIAKVHSALFAMHDDVETHEPKSPRIELSEAAESEVLQDESGSKAQNKECNDLEYIESFILPDIGEGVVECEVMQWHVNEGDEVLEDQAIVEVMTDKAIVEIPAKYAGKIVKMYYKKGDVAAVHSPLFDLLIGRNANAISNDLAAPDITNRAAKVVQDHTKQGESFEPPVDVGRAIASPAVRRLARENKIDLNAVKCSGSKGRVLKQDVVSFMSEHSGDTAENIVQAHIQPAERQHKRYDESSISSTLQSHRPNHAAQENNGKIAQDRTEVLKGVRAAMAIQMTASVRTIPHFSVSDELCMDNLIAVREKLKPEFTAQSVKLSFMPFFIKALSLALIQFPIVNSRLNEDATELTYIGAHNIGIAVDSKAGLIVPNIKNVQTLSVLEIAQAMNSLIEKAREGKLSSTDLSGGTIGISNVGAIGGINATPIIKKPNVAIVALGKIQKLPRFDANKHVVASHIMMLNWSGDHRVIDGATMVKFNNLWMDYLHHPEKMLVHLR